MDAVIERGKDRRQAARVPPEKTVWRRRALLRPGQEVRVVNISPNGALVESKSRLRPGPRAELHLLGGAARVAITGRLERCEVARLKPLRYRGAIVFDDHVPLRGEQANG